MGSNPQQQGAGSPPKPWEQAGGSSGPTPFKPPSAGNTSDVVESSGTANPGEVVPATNSAVNRNALGRPVPTRPWEQQQTYGSTYGGGMYGSSYGGLGGLGGVGSSYGGLGGVGSSYGGLGGVGSSYGGGMYGSTMNNRGGYGGMYGGSGMLGGGMSSGGLGGPMGGYGMGMGPYGNQDPNNPYGPPSSPPSFWVSMLKVMEGVVTFFGRIAILIDQNTQAFHMFMSALLQLFDRSGMLYGELARFVLRLLGVKPKPRKVQRTGPDGGPVPHNPRGNQNFIEGPKAAPSGAWDNVWGNDG